MRALFPQVKAAIPEVPLGIKDELHASLVNLVHGFRPRDVASRLTRDPALKVVVCWDAFGEDE